MALQRKNCIYQGLHRNAFWRFLSSTSGTVKLIFFLGLFALYYSHSFAAPQDSQDLLSCFFMLPHFCTEPRLRSRHSEGQLELPKNI